MVVGLIRIHLSALGESSDSFKIVRFIHASSGVGQVYLGSSGSLRRAFGVGWFIRARP